MVLIVAMLTVGPTESLGCYSILNQVANFGWLYRMTDHLEFFEIYSVKLCKINTTIVLSASYNVPSYIYYYYYTYIYIKSYSYLLLENNQILCLSWRTTCQLRTQIGFYISKRRMLFENTKKEEDDATKKTTCWFKIRLWRNETGYTKTNGNIILIYFRYIFCT